MKFYRFFPEKYRQATLGLNPYQDGCYRRLIDYYMEQRKPLPDDDDALARIIGISRLDWDLLAASKVRAYFKQKSGTLFQPNCDEELDFQDKRTKFFTDKAKKAATIRHSKNKEMLATSKAIAEPQPARIESRDITDNKLSVIPPLVPPTPENKTAKDTDTHQLEGQNFLLNNSVGLVSEAGRYHDGPDQQRPPSGQNFTKPENQPERAKNDRAKPKRHIPDDWQPDDENIQRCKTLNLDPDAIRDEFHSYWQGRGEPRADWQATFRNWIARTAQRMGERAARGGTGNNRPRNRSRLEIALEVADEFRRKGNIR